MTSKSSSQENVDDFYIIYEKSVALFNNLIEEQKKFMERSEKTTLPLNTFVNHQLLEAQRQSTQIDNSHKKMIGAYDDVIDRFEQSVDVVHESKYIELEKSRQIKTRVSALISSLTCVAVLFGGLNIYLMKKAHSKYNKIKGMPTTIEDKGEHYVKIKPKTEVAWSQDGKRVSFAKIA